ncbi:MAG: Stk1 family PASTA domain-containing Ser/Thr kinase [Clostridiales bacterium]|nr:Stk1 family PASTA domain-containing Ser/Thr kinase [Clostridiales bacterium]
MNLIGTMLAGRYEILEEIGKGGMAYVYKARCHFLNRLVAIKVLKEELRDDKEFVHRFNTEAQAAARISNPHVVSIYDVGFENGLYYIVMEYVDGITLKEYIAEKGVLPWRQAAEFAAQICEGLSAAHKKSVIHRDIKPQNIIMTEGGVLKVTDFGIARATTQATQSTSSSTIGTVHYLSPEQARGGYTNERTDIYSLGVVLYEMLTGRLPFNDNTAVAIAIKHIQEKPVLPRILNNEIPESMEYIVMKALNKEQNLRYASADAFLADLNKAIKNPNVVLGDAKQAADDLDRTVKRDAIDDRDIDNYERQRRRQNPEYGKYADRVDREVKENRQRNVDRLRAVKEQKKKERRITIAAVIAAIVVLAGLGVVFSMMTGGSALSVFTGGEKVKIPNVMDMLLTDAQKQYRQDGFSIVKKSEKASDKAAGTILEQNPPAGSEVTKKDDIVITVVVSSGANNIKVDNYTNLKIDEARKKIAESKLKVNEIEEESSTVAEGVVIRQEPSAGQEVSEGYLVTLYVSSGNKKDADKTQTEDKKNDSNKNDSTTTDNKSNNTQNGTQNGTGSTNGSNSGNTNGSSSGSGSGTGGSTSSGSGSHSGGTGSSSGGSSSSGSGSHSGGTGSSSSGGSSSGSGSGGADVTPGISN